MLSSPSFFTDGPTQASQYIIFTDGSIETSQYNHVLQMGQPKLANTSWANPS